MIDRSNYTTAEGALNGDEAVAFGNGGSHYLPMGMLW